MDERKGTKWIQFAGMNIPEIRWKVGELASWIGKGCVFLIPESKW